ncbi:MAG: oligosaccharide flippase family protein [Sedimentisphaerales bacterium]|jgi:O-antigen/teichoic acid export membrane protein
MMRNYPSEIMEKIYKTIFGEELTPRIRSFSSDLQIVAIGTGIATFLGLVFQILAGRFLGPSEYGKYSLIQSIGMILYVPMLFGFNTAMVKYSSEKEDAERQTKIISTTYIIVIALTVVLAAFFFLFQNFFANLFHTSGDLFRLAVIFAILYAFYTIATETARGLFKMKILAIFQSASAVIILLAFLLFVFVKAVFTFESAVYPTFFAYVVVSVVLPAVFLRKYLKLLFSKEWAGTLESYGVFAVIGGISYAIYSNIDKILINEYMTTSDLGIYKAYYLSSINVASLFSVVFNTVLFPTASRHRDRKDLFNKIAKLIPYMIVVGVPVVFVCEFVILKIYGSKYSMNFPLMFMFAATSILAVSYSLYDWLVASQGKRGIKISTIIALITAACNIIFLFCLLPHFALYGAILSLLLSYIVGLFFITHYKV